MRFGSFPSIKLILLFCQGIVYEKGFNLNFSHTNETAPASDLRRPYTPTAAIRSTRSAPQAPVNFDFGAGRLRQDLAGELLAGSERQSQCLGIPG